MSENFSHRVGNISKPIVMVVRDVVPYVKFWLCKKGLNCLIYIGKHKKTILESMIGFIKLMKLAPKCMIVNLQHQNVLVFMISIEK